MAACKFAASLVRASIDWELAGVLILRPIRSDSST